MDWHVQYNLKTIIPTKNRYVSNKTRAVVFKNEPISPWMIFVQPDIVWKRSLSLQAQEVQLCTAHCNIPVTALPLQRCSETRHKHKCIPHFCNFSISIHIPVIVLHGNTQNSTFRKWGVQFPALEFLYSLVCIQLKNHLYRPFILNYISYSAY